MTHIHKMGNEVECFYWMGSKLLKVHRCKLLVCTDQSYDWHQCNQWCTLSKGSSPSHMSLYLDVGGQDSDTAQLQILNKQSKHLKLFFADTLEMTFEKIDHFRNMIFDWSSLSIKIKQQTSIVTLSNGQYYIQN